MKRDHWKLTTIAAVLGAALAMPVAAQDKGSEQAQAQQQQKSAAGGQSAPSDFGQQRSGDDGGNWGWVGLLGLIGLAGLRRNRDEHRYGTTAGRP